MFNENTAKTSHEQSPHEAKVTKLKIKLALSERHLTETASKTYKFILEASQDFIYSEHRYYNILANFSICAVI